MAKTRTSAGFTLIEVMIVVIIIALVMTGVGFSIGATQRVKLRSSCYLVMAAIRYAYSRAVTQGTTVRLMMDFESRTLQLEETKGRVVLNREDETGEGLKAPDEDEEKEASESGDEPKKDSFLDLDGSSSSVFGGGLTSGMELTEEGGIDMSGLMNGSLDGTTVTGVFGNAKGYQRPSFKPLPGKRGKPRELEGETIFQKVFTPHNPNPREEGRAFVYFFSSGLGEHAFIQLSDGEERVYTVEVHPLSGKSFLYNEAVEPEEPLDDLQEAED
jgi:prepilin-type N-terminal cleavage/methylation domain-containing protein